MNDHGFHHFHVRKRMHKNLEPFPHPDKVKHFIDKLIYLISFIGLGMTIPQLKNVWIDKNAAGVSVSTWGTYSLISVFWLVYGIVHKETPIIYTQIVWIIFNALVFLGAVMYG